MSDRSIVAYEGFREGASNFDYFMCGLIGAVFAYLAESYEPARFSFSTSALESVSVVLLGASLFCGIKRLERVNQVMLLNHKLLDAAESREKYTTALNDGEFPLRRSGSNEPLSREDCHSHVERLRQAEISGRENIAKHKRAAGRYYAGRQYCFFIGLGALVAYKILTPYS